ncbi:hypothetical protein [Porcipelethomonas sp.]|uniref:hypothetical protein n=1 Tax=Porcipelethomonas sp. TaxID=2981675 RepID=UPI003077C969
MKKAELYRSIEGIKPDRSMKNRIMTAAEANDKITVSKKPVFLPVAVAFLLVINLGVIANLMAGDNFSSKHNGEDNSFYGNSTDEFSDYAEKVYKEITEHDYKKIEFLQEDNYFPFTDKPWFEMYSIDTIKKGAVETGAENAGVTNIFVKYIQTIDGIYTNHEYIIGYDGNGYEKENILSITESNVDYSSEIPEKYKNEISADVNLSDSFDKLVSEYSMEKYGGLEYPYESSYNNQYDMRILLFPSLKSNESAPDGIVYRFPAVFTVTAPQEADVDTIDENVYFLVDGQGNSQNQLSYDNYWKETVYADDASYETAELPEIENMNVDMAVRLLKNTGYTNISERYVIDERLHDTVISYDYGLMPGDVKGKNAVIGIIVSGKQMPDIIGMEIGDAGTVLNDQQIEYKIIYMYGAKADDTGQIVVSTSIGVNEIVNGSEPVEVFVESDSSCLAAGLWSEMDLEYSYSENGVDYYSSNELPDVILDGYYNDNGKVFVNGISTKSDYYEMCPDIYVGMSLEAIDIQLNEGFYYQDKEVSGISLIEYDSEMDYNYKFVYSDNDVLYTVLLKTVNEGSFEEQIVSNIYVTKEAVESEDSDNNQQAIYD